MGKPRDDEGGIELDVFVGERAPRPFHSAPVEAAILGGRKGAYPGGAGTPAPYVRRW